MQTFHFAPRKFLPEIIDLTDTAQLAPVFELLLARLDAVVSEADLEAWLRDHSEVCAALAESSSLAYIAMTCQTDDEAKEKAYMHIVEVVDPWLKPRQFALMQKLAQSPLFKELPPFYEVYCRSVETQVKIYREENVARETQVAKLTQQYQKISGAMTVHFDGQEQTLARMGRIQEEPDRPRREAAWKTVAERRLQDADKLEELFDQLLVLRNEIARAAGFADFRAYTFANYERFDYTPEDCLRFHAAVEHHVVPLARELQEERRRKLGLDKLRPWDLAVDPDQNPPLHPFDKSSELLEKCHQIFGKLDPRLGEYYHILRAQELVDLDNRKGKAPGGYQSTLSEARVPFIFMNAVGVHRDVETMLHEAGHAFHASPRASSRSTPTGARRSNSAKSRRWAWSCSPRRIWACSIPSRKRNARGAIISRASSNFSPGWRRSTRSSIGFTRIPATAAKSGTAFWLSLMDRFGGVEDWSGFEKSRAHMWHRQLHIFEIPFYYVEYGIAQLGALQLWQASRRDLHAALDHYLKGLSLGGSRPLPELFQAAASPSTSLTRRSRRSCAT